MKKDARGPFSAAATTTTETEREEEREENLLKYLRCPGAVTPRKLSNNFFFALCCSCSLFFPYLPRANER